MTDITKCEGKNCPKKDKCFRYLAKEGYYQSYFVMDDSPKDNCEAFWEVTNPAELKKLQREWDD